VLEMHIALCEAVKKLDSKFRPNFEIEDFEIERDEETGEYTVTEK
jgi:hypothetical protein